MQEHAAAKNELIVVIGMPGSGKTTHLNKLLAEGRIDTFYDDYQKGAPEEDKSNPRLSPRYDAVKNDLDQGKLIAISDIRYCISDELVLVTKVLEEDLPNVTVRTVFFANDPEACKHNVRLRGRPDLVDHELALIDKYSPQYSPEGEVLPVIMG